MHLRSLNLTLICQSSKGDEWEGVCSAQEDVKMSKCLRELPLSRPTSIYKPPQKIEPMKGYSAYRPDAQVDMTGRVALRPIILRRPCVACVQHRTPDLNGHLPCTKGSRATGCAGATYLTHGQRPIAHAYALAKPDRTRRSLNAPDATGAAFGRFQ
jgi:hypothetical protein